ncbi:MAG: DUF4830 domain-containing protein [Ruminococcaceae bacterium]|nr:DUF4830 domain-containing protein [Oscillospiraceae bacterium]
MFIYSLRANTIKFFGILCVALVALITLIAFLPSYEPDMAVAVTGDGAGTKSVSINYGKIKTNEDRIKFLEQFGWTVSADALQSEEVLIPAEFDKIFAGYNEIQKSQGLDLGKYKKKKLMRYTYEVTNYEGYEGKVLANILVYRGKVVGGDICSADADGFLQGFEK